MLERLCTRLSMARLRRIILLMLGFLLVYRLAWSLPRPIINEAAMSEMTRSSQVQFFGN